MKLFFIKEFCLLIFVIIQIINIYPQNKCKYRYREHLVSQKSSHTIDVLDTLIDSGKSNLIINFIDNKNEPLFGIPIELKNNKSKKNIISNFYGSIFTSINPDSYSFSIPSLQYTEIQLDSLIIKPNSKTILNIVLGSSNILQIVIICSIRELNKDEIIKIIYDLSNGNENELIINKTCDILIEI